MRLDINLATPMFRCFCHQAGKYGTRMIQSFQNENVEKCIAFRKMHFSFHQHDDDDELLYVIMFFVYY